jgi:hypothetical protein
MRLPRSGRVAGAARVLLAVLALLSGAGQVSAASRTWGVTLGFWSTGANWGGTAPGASDTAIFTPGNAAATLDVDVSVAGLNVQSGATATLTQQSTRQFHVLGSVTLAGTLSLTATYVARAHCQSAGRSAVIRSLFVVPLCTRRCYWAGVLPSPGPGVGRYIGIDDRVGYRRLSDAPKRDTDAKHRAGAVPHHSGSADRLHSEIQRRRHIHVDTTDPVSQRSARHRRGDHCQSVRSAVRTGPDAVRRW